MKKLIIILTIIIFVLLGCATRKPISYFQPGMTKQDVVQAYGDKAIKTFRTVERKTYEIWQYNFTRPTYVLFYGASMETNRFYFVFDGDILIETHLKEPPPIIRAIVR